MIFDIEGDGLLDKVTKLHVMSYDMGDGVVKSTTSYDEMRRLITTADLLIGHNIILFDIPTIEKILGVSPEL